MRVSSLRGKNINLNGGFPISKILSKYITNYYCTIDQIFTGPFPISPNGDSGFSNGGYEKKDIASTPGRKVLGTSFSYGSSIFLFHPPFSSEPSQKDIRTLIDYLKLSTKKSIISSQAPKRAKDAFPDERQELEKLRKQYVDKRNQLDSLSNLYWQSGKELEKSVEFSLKQLGIEVENIARNGDSKDLVLHFPEKDDYYMEIKGLKGSADKDQISNFIANNLNKKLIFLVNHYRTEPPDVRIKKSEIYFPFTPAAIETMKLAMKDKGIEEILPISTLDLANLILSGVTKENLLEKFRELSTQYLTN